MLEIKCENLIIGYEGKKIAENINFSIASGDYLCIVGKNGSGKSTLMKTILGLIKPLGGTITFCESVKKTEIGYIPQQTDVQKDFPASAYEIVLSGCLSGCGYKPFYTHKQKEIAKQNMKLLGIENLSKQCYRELSGGQQQRVLLARALCAAKKIILLDEPVAGLDPNATRELYDIIENLNKNQKMTIIMISHDIHATIKYASHVLVVDSVCYFGKKEEFINSIYFKKDIVEEQ